jgi:8-amino-7-oxononanoate synthase
LSPVVAGRPHLMMSPTAFLQNPIAWLGAISKHRATISGGPNFAYDLCVRKVTEEQRAGLDLSCWNLAYVGAEPIMPDTLDRFVEVFGGCGFKREAFYPCYGMAEATLMVTGSKRFFGPVVRAFDEQELAHGRAVVVAEGAGHGRRLVSSGAAIGGLTVAVVEPESQVECADGKVGEVWVNGPSTGQGYWENPIQSRTTFGARIVGGGEGARGANYLRTGDLGFFVDGQLYITGRMDDLMIVRGVNHHPQDIEATARNSHPLLENGVGAAFLVDDAKGPAVVLVHEISRVGTEDLSPVLDAVRAGVLDGHGLALSALLLVRQGAVPRTTSGKVQRKGCKAAYLEGEIKAVGQFVSAAEEREADAGLGALAPDASVSFVVAVICQHAHTMAGVPLGSINAQTELAGLGLDSLKRMELLAVLEKTFAGHLPDSEIAQAVTVADLARSVQRHLIDRPKDGTLTREVPSQHYEIAQFPEYAQLKRQEMMLRSVAGENPYFRVDQGNAPAGMAHIQGKELVNFCVYDYLGMAYDKHVAKGATEAIARYGVSAGASRLVAGQKQVHQDLEEGLAAFLGTAGAIVFVSGHATNVTAIGHLLSPGDLIAHDMLAHNSIIQGAKLSGATTRAFTHNDWRALDAFLEHERHRYRRVLIAIEGVYSMDGDWPDLPRFIELKKKHKTLLLVDEAHSLGTMGATGRGVGEHFGVDRLDVDLWMGTLSKSLASCGGYIAGSAELVEYFRYTAPGFIYSVGLSPPVAAAALAALEVLKAEPGRVARLRELSALFLECAKGAGLDTGLACGSPVVPVIVGNSVKCVKLSQALFDRGINVQPILYPAVSEAAARLRFFITTNHSEEQVRGAVRAAAEELGRL